MIYRLIRQINRHVLIPTIIDKIETYRERKGYFKKNLIGKKCKEISYE